MVRSLPYKVCLSIFKFHCNKAKYVPIIRRGEVTNSSKHRACADCQLAVIAEALRHMLDDRLLYLLPFLRYKIIHVALLHVPLVSLLVYVIVTQFKLQSIERISLVFKQLFRKETEKNCL